MWPEIDSRTKANGRNFLKFKIMEIFHRCTDYGIFVLLLHMPFSMYEEKHDLEDRLWNAFL